MRQQSLTGILHSELMQRESDVHAAFAKHRTNKGGLLLEKVRSHVVGGGD